MSQLGEIAPPGDYWRLDLLSRIKLVPHPILPPPQAANRPSDGTSVPNDIGDGNKANTSSSYRFTSNHYCRVLINVHSIAPSRFGSTARSPPPPKCQFPSSED